MIPPTAEQRKWAADGLAYTIQCYDEWTREGHRNFTPMLRLLDHIGESAAKESLSVWKSLADLSVASASHVVTQHNLADGAPCLWITQDDNEFVFRDASGKKRKCAFEDSVDLFDVQLVRLKMQIDDFDARASQITNG